MQLPSHRWHTIYLEENNDSVHITIQLLLEDVKVEYTFLCLPPIPFNPECFVEETNLANFEHIIIKYWPYI